MNAADPSESPAVVIKAVGPKRRNGLAAFRAVEAEVRSALDAGWTVIAVYEAQQQKLAMSYAQFARYAQPLRRASRSASAVARAPSLGDGARRDRLAVTGGTGLTGGGGPPRGRPEKVIPTLDMDGFAAKALNNEDLF
jgi:hypothetical protein